MARSEIESTAILEELLEVWKQGIDDNRPEDVAVAFTDDALFQGLQPDPAYGRDGVVSYYAPQPPDLRANYRLIRVRAIGDEAILGYLVVDFGFADGRINRTHLTVLAELADEGWKLSHYHVSKIE